jgi:hypothetical protein
MSIFGSIVSAIFGGSSAAGAATAGATTGSATAGRTPAAPAGGATSTGATPEVAGQGKNAPMTRAEVEAMIQQIEDDSGQKYNWRQSIVDLMKLLDLDSSLNARKQLAQELGYTGALDGSAQMNTWLHQQVMTRLMEGKDIQA